MTKQPITPKQNVWLLKAAAEWRRREIISDDQSRSILALYESEEEIKGRQSQRIIFALMGLAALLVGLAALLVVGYNWEVLSRPVKLGLVFGVILLTHGGSLALYNRGEKSLAEVGFFLGCLFYGTGIWLVAQIFHINAHYPDGVYWWALGVLPFALALNTRLLHTLYAGLLALWVGMEITQFWHLGWWWDWMPNGAYSLPLLVLPGFAWAYRKKSPFTVSLYAALLAWWAILQPVAWQWEENILYFIGGVGAFFLLVAETHTEKSPFAPSYRFFGYLLCCGALVPLSFYDANKHMVRHASDDIHALPVILVAGIALLSLSGLYLLKQREERTIGHFFLDLIKRQSFGTVLLLLMTLLPLWNMPGSMGTDVASAALVPTILANVAMVVCALILMSGGLREDRGKLFSWGVLYFLLWTVLRYVDLFGDYGGMLGAALMFFLCGASLFYVAFYWRRRKEVSHA